jgi:hypothetical protein
VEFDITHRIDISDLKRFRAGASGTLDIRDHEVSIPLIQRTASLSKRLERPVLAVEVTDDDYGMAVVVNADSLRYLRFRTTRKSAIEGESPVEVTYTPEAGFIIDHEPASDIYGLAQTAIEDVFHATGLTLRNYVEEKPSREEARQSAAAVASPVNAYIDSFGVFRRLSHARPQVKLIDRMLLPFRYAVSFLLLPFILMGMITFAVIRSGSSKVDADAGAGRLFCIGLAVLATPILFLIWVIRGLMGS